MGATRDEAHKMGSGSYSKGRYKVDLILFLSTTCDGAQ
jgi:hypothetical protein